MHEFVLPDSAEGDFRQIEKEKNAFLSTFRTLQKQWLLKKVAAVFREVPKVDAVEFMVLRFVDDDGRQRTGLSVNWLLADEELTDDELWLLKQGERSLEGVYSPGIDDFVDGLTVSRQMLCEPNGAVRSVAFVAQQLAALGRH
jgi:hypothetical protein